MAIEPVDSMGRPAGGWRLRLYRVIYESDTAAGRLFDKLIVAAIVISVAVVMADSVRAWHSFSGSSGSPSTSPNTRSWARR